VDLLLASAAVPLHAGFAFVATVSEALLNAAIDAAVANLVPPLTAGLPNRVQLGNQPVLLNGTLVVLPPSVTLKARADNLVTAHVAFAGVVTTGVGPSTTSFELVLKADLDVGLVTQIIGNKQLAVGVDFTQAKVDAVDIFSISGGLPVGGVQAALRDPTVLTVLTGALRALRQITATPGVLKSEYNLAPTYQPPPSGGKKYSIFSPRTLFDLTIAISRIVVKPLDGALAVAVDLAGLSAGDPSGIVDLNTAWVPSATVRTVHQGGYSSLGGARYGPRDSDFAVTANADVITQIAGQVSGQISGKFPVDEHVRINGLSASFAPVHAPLSAISVPGIVTTVNVTYWANTSRDADGYIQPDSGAIDATATISTDLELVTFDGPTAWLSRQPPDYYTTRVVNVDIDPSGFLAAAILAAAYFLSVITWGVAAPIAIIGVIELLDGMIPGILADVESQVQATVQAGLNAGENSLSITTARRKGITVENVLDADGIYTFANVDVVATPAAYLDVTPGTFDNTRVNNDPSFDPPPGWHISVYDRTPVTCRLVVPPLVANAQDPTWRVAWSVTRTDTNAMIVNTDQLASAPGALQIQIDHASAVLMPVDTFLVTCRLYRNLGYTVQDALSSSFYVDIDDYLDRHHPYLYWNHVVYWQVKGQPPGTYWTRRRHSRIHRTGVPGRCEVMRTRRSHHQYVYLDALPFPLSELNAHRRGVLCDYCFFGGPTRTVPLMDIPEIVPDPKVYREGS
jgi:hypothetical protein